ASFVRRLSPSPSYSSSFCLSPFFSSRYAAHRDLHSFPTRRSSDLHQPALAHGKCEDRVNHARPPPCPSRLSPQSCSRRRNARRRSEEHTSELQSHLNLVCRLLLEKKKKNN